MAKTQEMSGIIPAQRVRQFIRSIAHEMLFYSDEQIAGRAIVKKNSIYSVFTIGGAELTIKMKEAI